MKLKVSSLSIFLFAFLFCFVVGILAGRTVQAVDVPNPCLIWTTCEVEPSCPQGHAWYGWHFDWSPELGCHNLQSVFVACGCYQ